MGTILAPGHQPSQTLGRRYRAPVEPGEAEGQGHEEGYRRGRRVTGTEAGAQGEGPAHPYLFKHGLGREQCDLTRGTGVQEPLSTEGKIPLQNLPQGAEGGTGLSKEKGKQPGPCCRGGGGGQPS